jgi:hypothetical protein
MVSLKLREDVKACALAKHTPPVSPLWRLFAAVQENSYFSLEAFTNLAQQLVQDSLERIPALETPRYEARSRVGPCLQQQQL